MLSLFPFAPLPPAFVIAMASFFSKFQSSKEPPKQEEPTPENKQDSSDTEHGSNTNLSKRDSKPSSEKESTLVEEPRDSTTTPVDTSKETASSPSPEAVPNEDSNKESLSRSGADKEASDTDLKGELMNNNEESNEDNPLDDTNFPSAWRLLLITIALCLCVFCVALV